MKIKLVFAILLLYGCTDSSFKPGVKVEFFNYGTGEVIQVVKTFFYPNKCRVKTKDGIYTEYCQYLTIVG